MKARKVGTIALESFNVLQLMRLCCFAVNSPLFQLQVEMVKKSLVAWEEETGARSQEHKIV